MSLQHLSHNALAKGTVLIWNLKPNLENHGATQEQHKSQTSTGRNFALVEGLSHDLVCAGSIYHVHFAWQVWQGQYSPHFKFNKLKSFSRGEIDQNHVDKRILGGKGLQYEGSTSITFVRPVRYGTGVALTLRCSCGSTQLSVSATPEPQSTGQRNGVDLEFEAKFGKPWGNPRTTQKPHCVTAQVLH